MGPEVHLVSLESLSPGIKELFLCLKQALSVSFSVEKRDSNPFEIFLVGMGAYNALNSATPIATLDLDFEIGIFCPLSEGEVLTADKLGYSIAELTSTLDQKFKMQMDAHRFKTLKLINNFQEGYISMTLLSQTNQKVDLTFKGLFISDRDYLDSRAKTDFITAHARESLFKRHLKFKAHLIHFWINPHGILHPMAHHFGPEISFIEAAPSDDAVLYAALQAFRYRDAEPDIATRLVKCIEEHADVRRLMEILGRWHAKRIAQDPTHGERQEVKYKALQAILCPDPAVSVDFVSPEKELSLSSGSSAVSADGSDKVPERSPSPKVSSHMQKKKKKTQQAKAKPKPALQVELKSPVAATSKTLVARVIPSAEEKVKPIVLKKMKKPKPPAKPKDDEDLDALLREYVAPAAPSSVPADFSVRDSVVPIAAMSLVNDEIWKSFFYALNEPKLILEMWFCKQFGRRDMHHWNDFKSDLLNASRITFAESPSAKFWTPLQFTIIQGDWENLLFLLALGARVDVEISLLSLACIEFASLHSKGISRSAIVRVSERSEFEKVMLSKFEHLSVAAKNDMLLKYLAIFRLLSFRSPIPNATKILQEISRVGKRPLPLDVCVQSRPMALKEAIFVSQVGSDLYELLFDIFKFSEQNQICKDHIAVLTGAGEIPFLEVFIFLAVDPKRALLDVEALQRKGVDLTELPRDVLQWIILSGSKDLDFIHLDRTLLRICQSGSVSLKALTPLIVAQRAHLNSVDDEDFCSYVSALVDSSDPDAPLPMQVERLRVLNFFMMQNANPNFSIDELNLCERAKRAGNFYIHKILEAWSMPELTQKQRLHVVLACEQIIDSLDELAITNPAAPNLSHRVAQLCFAQQEAEMDITPNTSLLSPAFSVSG